MPWFNVDDGFAFHHKAVKAGNAAIGLWTRAGSWCAQQLTDGAVPEHMVAVLGTPAQAKRLVDSGLWIKTENGYQFHEWSTERRNPTKKEVLERRRKDADKKASARSAKADKSASPQLETVSPQGTLPGFPEGVTQGVGSTPPLPSQKNKDSLRSPLHAAEKIHAGTITAAWVDAYEPASGLKAKAAMKGQVAKEAAGLISAGAAPSLVLAAAKAVGSKGLATLEREYAPMVAKMRKAAPSQAAGEINPDDVLGKDTWTVPTPPREIRDGPHEGLLRWDREKRAERRSERVEEARRVLERKAA
jgi:hypothetical protein